MKRPILILALVGVLLLGWAASRYFAAPPPRALFEGFVEGDLVQIGPIEAERLATLNVEPGVNVARGAPLFTMATPVLDAQRAEAQARVEQAKATLENLKAALNRPEQIAVLNAGLDRAKASLALSQADFDRQAALLPRGATTVAQRDQAKFAFDRDKAALAEAQRQIDAALLPSRSGEISGAEAAILQANAQLHQIDTRIARQSVAAPAGGVIQDVFFWPGEIIAAGQPILALLPPENRKFRFYVNQDQLSRFTLGAPVAVSCDGCGPEILARVIYISQQAEFTPPVIFSLQERGKLSFRIAARPETAEAQRKFLLPLGQPIGVRLVDANAPATGPAQ